MVFGPFSRQPLEISWRNLVRSETKWIRRRCKRPEANILSLSGDIWAQNRQKSTKITKILWMIQKFFEKIFLAQTILNGPIRKVIIVKVKFEDLRNFFYYQVNQARHLENFSKKNFFEKNFFVQKVSKWSNSKSYRGKSEIWRPLENIPFSSSLARHL